MKRVGIVGAGYVGLVSGACFAKLGHTVICADNDKEKIETLKKGKIPIYEPGLEEAIAQARSKNKAALTFTTDITQLTKSCEAIFICVGTPPNDDGSADLSAIENVTKEIARNLQHYTLIIEKSTVPVATGERIAEVVKFENKKGIAFDVASNPEFLREGTALHDFFNPDRIVFGAETPRAEKLLRELYHGIEAPIIITDIKSAELIKHASNSFLATKIAFANALSRICDIVGADVVKVTQGMGYDKRIGPAFLQAGAGVGGFCLPKDIDAFYHISKYCGYDFRLLKEVKQINEAQKGVIVQKLEEELWNLRDKTIAILGLSFKPDTDDLRFAPSLDIIKILTAKGAKVKAFDPVSMPKARAILDGTKVTLAKDTKDCLKGAHAVILMTEWNDFKKIDFAAAKKTMAGVVIIDGRNCLDAGKLKTLGFRYRGIGRN